MFLQRLVEYAQRSPEIAPATYNAEPVRYWIQLDSDGQLLGIVPVESEDGRRVRKVVVPTLVRTAGIRPKLLADNAEYTFGLAREGAKPERVAQAHGMYLELTRRCAQATGEPGVNAVLRFLEELDSTDLPLPDGFDSSALMGFEVDGARPSDLPSVQAFWQGEAVEGEAMQCLVCGRTKPAMERLNLRLKGVPGGQTAGLALISANNAAFESYRLKASYTAPTCLSCSDQFMKGANQLIAGENTHLRLGNVMYIFWTRDDTPFDAMRLLTNPEPSQVRALLRTVFQPAGRELDTTPFYVAAITASGARAVVRDWIDTTVERAQRQLGRYFALQQVTDVWDGEIKGAGLFGLARSTVRTGSRDDPPAWVFTALVHCALLGGPLPSSLLFKAVERCRVERGVTHSRAALIKLVLLSQQPDSQSEGGDRMAVLDTENLDPAYLCGRLFAELEAVQRAALGKVGATIVDRYYGTASSAPATVFGRLVRGAQPHLGKLRRVRPPAYHALDGRLGEIMEHLDGFPTTLDLEEQALFALGYYHQRAADRRAAREHGIPLDGVTSSNEDTETEEEN